MRTHFRDFNLPGPITVEFAVDGGYSPTTYSPMFGSDGGDVPEFSVVDVWPNTETYNRLLRRRDSLNLRFLASDGFWDRLALRFWVAMADREIAAANRAVQLNDDQREFVEAAIAETWVDDDPEPDEDWRMAERA